MSCHYDFPDHLWKVDADNGRLSQVIQNIVLNAKHAMPEGGTITIACANVQDAATESLLSVDKGDYVRIAIVDTGVVFLQVLNKYQELQDSGTPVDLVIMDLTISGGMGGEETARKLLALDPSAKNHCCQRLFQ